MLGTELIARFEQHFPLSLGEKGDPNGLHIGTLNKEVQRVMITLDVRPNVVAEAIEKKVDLIIAKHPPLFRPAERLTDADPQTKMYLDLIEHHIAVYAAHTNMDIVEDGLNDWFCEALDVHETTFLTQTHEFPYYILQTMVPTAYAHTVRSALAEAGAGTLGAYEKCSFSTVGLGRFEPTVDANPFIGSENQLEEVAEEKIEVLVDKASLSSVIATLLEHHPYETPSYQCFPTTVPTQTFGIGRIGNLSTPCSLKELADKIKEKFHVDHVRLISKEDNPMVQRVAICGGSGQKFYPDALRKGADVYITGDVYYHTGHDMLETGMSVIDAGHYIENYCKERLVTLLEGWKQANHWEVEIFASQEGTNPFVAY